MKVTRMLSAGAVVLTLTAVTGCRASTRVALDGGMVDESGDAACTPALANGLQTFLPIEIKNETGLTAHITGVSMPKSSPFRVVDWWVIPVPKAEIPQGIGTPWAKPGNAPTVVGAGRVALVALEVRAKDPNVFSHWSDGFYVAYKTSRGAAEVTAKSGIAVAARGGSCPDFAPPGA
ncbi:hypothetical protein [Rudaeicoccus suwonensis]|uniref:Lipoprotein n=1 Tax=Rudaeicoccus suwonensis TaxID=657409 RepID=A0A561E3R8_9MICO|nr:hypothetical protein [Rudaeicoccus suwonensis]TWE10239.1 hypothetical protein BKA23_2593 [Rudaeicoccus suwonensis]